MRSLLRALLALNLAWGMTAHAENFQAHAIATKAPPMLPSLLIQIKGNIPAACRSYGDPVSTENCASFERQRALKPAPDMAAGATNDPRHSFKDTP